ncbi:hypothetical protein GHT06_014560 [Daphnia sinensis]|uniref:Metalloendopeptidase n=1 Tax=Daphnia sinensis TaxID=1820382 RepID=A0AAD5KQ29_9CRUS|nr:hypothetical protein GHT06_014560 [Daphnia sinensis]
MATKSGSSYLFLFSAGCVAIIVCCWANCVEANPLWTENENQLDSQDRNEIVFEAGEPLTDEEFKSGVQGKAASIDNQGQSWEKQAHSGLVGGDLLPGITKSANKNAAAKWANAQVPYVISSSFSGEERQIIASAMDVYHQKTCIRFVPRRTQSEYLKIIRSRESKDWSHYPGCWAGTKVGGVLELSLDNGCVTRSIAIHELMHALGFGHEQQRPDQAKYIIVKYDNIEPKNHQWFKPDQPNPFNTVGRYDINSVMHYGAYTCAIDPSKPTMVTKDGRTSMGINNGPTANLYIPFLFPGHQMDLRKLNTMYCKY